MEEVNLRGLLPETVGERIRRLRLQQDLSVRDLADRAGVDKNTILRLEKGLPTSGRTLGSVCEALGVYVSRLLLPAPEEGETVTVHRRSGETWFPYPGMGDPFPEGEEVNNLPRTDTDVTAVLSLACAMERGRLRSSLLRLYAETTPNAHPGEEFVFCLSGSARITVAGRTYHLSEGDAATFWCAERHTYAPDKDSELPVLLLAVWLDARDERK